MEVGPRIIDKPPPESRSLRLPRNNRRHDFRIWVRRELSNDALAPLSMKTVTKTKDKSCSSDRRALFASKSSGKVMEPTVTTPRNLCDVGAMMLPLIYRFLFHKKTERLNQCSGINEQVDFFRKRTRHLAKNVPAQEIQNRIAFRRSKNQTGGAERRREVDNRFRG